MFTLTASEIIDFQAAVEMGWAKPVSGAAFKHADNYGEIASEHTFYRLDKQVFCAIYENRTTQTTYREVTGEGLELFNIFYGEG